MDRLRLIRTFTAVARARSFSAAADTLGISRAGVTKQIAALEASLKVQLLTRTTHAVNLTEAGIALLEHGDRLLQDFEALESRLQSGLANPSGIVRIGTPPSFGAFHLVPAIRAFKRAHPDIRVVLSNDDGSVDIVRCGLDMSIRIAPSLRDASFVTRLLGRVPQVLVASPGYLERHGCPLHAADLARHDCLVHTVKSPGGVWRFRHRGEALAIRVSGGLSSNFGEAIRSAALIGEGIAMHPTYMVDEDLRAGRLRIVLPDHEPTGLEIRAIYVRRALPARVSVFLGFLRTWVKRQARWPLSPQQMDRDSDGFGALHHADMAE